MSSQDGHAGAREADTRGRGADYDSRADTLTHSLRVGALLVETITELMQRAVRHDLSKTEEPELSVFNTFTPQLKATRYGSQAYKANLAAMGAGLAHHYRHNRHHPEHFTDGVNGMTLVDMLEMLADWKAATERSAAGDLRTSLAIQQERFAIDPQLARTLHNTAEHFGWLTPTPSS